MCEQRRGRREEKRRESSARIAIAKKEEALPSGTLAGREAFPRLPSVSLRSTPLRQSVRGRGGVLGRVQWQRGGRGGGTWQLRQAGFKLLAELAMGTVRPLVVLPPSLPSLLCHYLTLS